MPVKPPVVADGDSGFVGVNMRMNPALLPPGYVSEAKNKRFTNGKAATRPGIKKMPWTNKSHAAWEQKSYDPNDIVTYSGRAAVIEGSSASIIESGSGTVTLHSTNAILNNGYFTTSSDWSTAEDGSVGGLGTGSGSTGWRVDEGGVTNYAEHVNNTSNSASADNLYQDINAVLGCDYSITLTVSGYSGGTLKVFVGTQGSSETISYLGTHTVTVTSAGASPNRLYIQASADFVGIVDTILISEGATPEKVALRAIEELADGSGQYNTSGPASNNSTPSGGSGEIGPFFQRDSSTDPGTEPPIATYDSSTDVSTLTSGWNDLGSRTYGYGTVYGAGIFRDPQSVEYLLVATAEGVYATKESNPSVLLAGGSISADVEFVQCFNVVIMFRGESLEPLVMERVDEGFKSITSESSDLTIDENDSDGTVTIPNGSTGLFFSNRLLVPHDKDLVAASDYLNYTRYQPVLANFKVNQGSEDELVSLVRINNSTVACFKTNSIYIVSNIYGNLSDITLDEVTREYGAVGRNSIVQVGSDVVFLSSKRGVTSLGIADNGKVTAVDLPLSDPIQPLIDRINWNHASGASAAYHNNRLYMAVPLDGATENNAILVYDFLVKAWAGHDEGADIIKVKKFVETVFQGKRRLFFLSTDGFINLYDDDLSVSGFVDEKGSSDGSISIQQVSDEITTRGYTGDSILSKRWSVAEVQLATSEPNLTVKAVFDGASENTKVLKDGLTFDRTKYDKPFYATDFNASMSGDDFFTQYRQDYSVDPDTEIALPTTGSETGFDPDLHQQSQNRFKYRGEGKYVQLKLENTNGRVELLGAGVGGSSASQSAVKQV
tara:strand:- start:368 stop:2869 length:2502 start_codon:yes stop_codon:yes gene_type:complete